MPIAQNHGAFHFAYPQSRNLLPQSRWRTRGRNLRLTVEEQLIGFYRQDTNEKLLIPDELVQALQNAEAQSSQAHQRAEQERRRADRLAEHLRPLGVDPDSIA
jgi:hypothetical protein